MITLSGNKELSRRLDKIGKHDFDKTIRNTSGFVIKVTKRGFASQKAPSGRSWPKRTQSRPWPLLDRTGRLKSSFKARESTGKATIYSNNRIFKFHQLGTRNLPARVMLAVNDQMVRYSQRELKREAGGL